MNFLRLIRKFKRPKCAFAILKCWWLQRSWEKTKLLYSQCHCTYIESPAESLLIFTFTKTGENSPQNGLWTILVPRLPCPMGEKVIWWIYLHGAFVMSCHVTPPIIYSSACVVYCGISFTHRPRPLLRTVVSWLYMFVIFCLYECCLNFH